MNDYERFDGLFTTIASGVNGIDPLMDAFFGFLGRKTDFYQPGAQDEAKKVTLQYLEKHRVLALKRYDDERERNKKIDEEKRKRHKDKELEAFIKNQEKLKKGPVVEEVFDDEEEKKEKVKPGVNKSVETKIAQKDVKIDGDNDDADDDSKPPVGNGGVTDKYEWTQTLGTVDVMIKVPPGTTARQCKITMTTGKLKVEVKGEVILDGEFDETIKSDASMWTLEDNKVVHLTLEKKQGMRWWSCVLKGDPKINTQKIVPENSKISDLDSDLRQTVEKMMYDQEMKNKGLPTSAETKQAAILEQFKKSHPEMDFSNAKINWGSNG